MVDLGEQFMDLIFGPIVQNAGHGEQVCMRQFVAEKIAGQHPDALRCHDRLAGLGARSLDDLGQIEHNSFQIGIAFASGDCQMAGGATQVHQSPEAREVEGFHYSR